MKKHFNAGFAMVFAAMCLAMLAAGPAQAQASRTWVSGVGDDANPCSRTAPCKTFAGAISKTAPGGEIDCLDPGGFGALTITKAITIFCHPMSNGGVLVAGTNGIVVAAGANDVVVLSGLDFDGVASTGVNGIQVNSGNTLIVKDCDIRNFSQYGINVSPTAANTFQVYISNSLIENNAGGGILLTNASGQMLAATINRTELVKNNVGINGQAPASGKLQVTIVDTVASENPGSGIVAATQGASIVMVLDHVTSSNSVSGFGVLSFGAGAQVAIGNSTIEQNLLGASASSGGIISSYKNNIINFNGNDGTPLPQSSLN